MNALPKIFIIVLHFKNAADTKECLQSLQSLLYPHFEIILIDNGSKDASFDELAKQFPSCIVIKNQENLGFAEGNNVGIRYALQNGADYLLLLNNDTTVDPDLLSAFMEAAIASPNAGAFGAKIYFYDQPTVIWHAGGKVSQDGRCYHEGSSESTLQDNKESLKEIEYACGCALFISRTAIEKAGLFDPKFFLIWEEIDLCFRIRAKGLCCLFVPKAKVWHKISQSFDGGNRGPLWQYFYWRNRLLFLEKHYPLSYRFSLYRRVFLKELFQILKYALFSKKDPRQKELNRFALKGIRDYCLRNFFAGKL